MKRRATKPARAASFVLCLVAAGAAGAASSPGHGKDHTSSLSPAGGPVGARGGHGGMAGERDRMELRHPPPLVPERKVDEQDCRKPMDPSLGNLKCK